MTKADAFVRAWELAQKGDFSFFDEILHTDYESENQGGTCSCNERKAGSKRTRSHLLVIRSAESKVNSGKFTQMFVCL